MSYNKVTNKDLEYLKTLVPSEDFVAGDRSIHFVFSAFVPVILK